ncbi:hypothetical protein DL95DRAFT_454319 [Leptodontidium sp. 2 PMI_412]|nr:hypothetical protein DL95DRAFT_454319 [Leptodontidium sp. 2 PMI_412]
MVDDTMEISSDHGHNEEQGDIDIDLDLTAGPGDEDFILEDATSLVDFGNDFNPQPSTVVNDDIMVDDDNESYQMEDAELLDQESEHIMEQEMMSFAPDGDASYYDDNDQAGGQSVADDTNGLSYDGYDAAKDESLGFDLQQNPEATLLDDNVQDLGDSHSKITDDPTQGTPAQGSQTPSSSHHSLPPTAPIEPRSPPVSVTEPGLSPSHNTHDDPSLPSPHDADDSAAGISTISSSLQQVVVVYREVEYALFSTSEHDDPDLYFLSDMSIVEKPLSEFFRAIREVIREDLVDEDELCIVVDSLGLQAEEGSSIVENVPLLQVLNLHTKLSENDGPESTGGCHIVLKTRTSFSRRLSNLVAGAAEGKGLSEFAYWDDQSIGLEDSEDPEENKYDFESIVEGQDSGQVGEDYNEQQQYEHAGSNGLGHDAAVQEDKQDRLQIPETEAEIVQNTGRQEVARSSGGSTIASPKSTGSEPLQKTQNRDSDVDEDGDLIDYSEDEDVLIEKRKTPARPTDNNEAATGIYTDFLHSNCALPQTCFCSKCSVLIIEEFEKRDELLRRRSLDRRQSSSAINLEEHEGELEELGLERQKSNDAGETSLPTEEERGRHEPGSHPVEEEEYTGENEIEYENFRAEEGEDLGGNDYASFDENPLEYGGDQTEQDGLALIAQVDTENDENCTPLEQYEEVGNHADADLDHDYAAEQDANYESAITNFENDDLEFEVGNDSFHDESKQDNDLLEQDETKRSISLQDTSKASSLDVLETAESSVTMGADEIQYEDDLPDETNNLAESDESGVLGGKGSQEAAVANEQKDEIGYEDDDEEAELSLQSPALVSEAQASQNANGKRSIADVESNDTQTLQTKDAKRPRS